MTLGPDVDFLLCMLAEDAAAVESALMLATTACCVAVTETYLETDSVFEGVDL